MMKGLLSEKQDKIQYLVHNNEYNLDSISALADKLQELTSEVELLRKQSKSTIGLK